MRRLLTSLVLAAIVSIGADPAPAALQTGPAAREAGIACGADAPNGLIIHYAYDVEGKAVDPPLAVTDPTGATSRPVNVPDPREIIPLDYDCKALVKSAEGGTYLVDGATGEALRLELGDLEAELRYDKSVGGTRWGVFSTSGISGEGSVLVDFETGSVAPLIDTDLSPLAYVFMHFSPSGSYLVISSNMLAEEADNLLVPMERPEEARLFGDTSAFFLAIDERDERLLYLADGPDGAEQLIIEEIATGTTQVVGTDPAPVDGELTLSGRFLPGDGDLLAVYYVDRLAIVDLSSGEPVERSSIDGDWGSLRLAPDGTTAIIASDVPLPVSDGVNPPQLADATWAFVDVESGTITPLVSGAGIPVQVIGPGNAGWILAEEPGDNDPKTLLRVQIETGELVPILTLTGETVAPEATRFADDGSRAVLVTTIEGNQQRVRLIDVESGDVRELVTAGRVSGSISPDGRWVSFSTLESGDGERTLTLVTVDAETGEEVFRGPGLSPVWLRP